MATNGPRERLGNSLDKTFHCHHRHPRIARLRTCRAVPRAPAAPWMRSFCRSGRTRRRRQRRQHRRGKREARGSKSKPATGAPRLPFLTPCLRRARGRRRRRLQPFRPSGSAAESRMRSPRTGPRETGAGTSWRGAALKSSPTWAALDAIQRARRGARACSGRRGIRWATRCDWNRRGRCTGSSCRERMPSSSARCRRARQCRTRLLLRVWRMAQYTSLASTSSERDDKCRPQFRVRIPPHPTPQNTARALATAAKTHFPVRGH